MKYDHTDSLQDIYYSMQLTQEFTHGMSFSEFHADEKTVFAVIRCIEVIGEAVKRLPEPFRESYSDIPWKAMAGMRDRLIHGYDIVDDEIVWNTVTQTIPSLLSRFSEILHRL